MALRLRSEVEAGPSESVALTGRAGVSDVCGECGVLFGVCHTHSVGNVCTCTPCPSCPRAQAIRALPALHDLPEILRADYSATVRYAAVDALAAIARGDAGEISRRARLLALCGRVTTGQISSLCDAAARALIDYLGEVES